MTRAWARSRLSAKRPVVHGDVACRLGRSRMSYRFVLLMLGILALDGCQTASRRAAPPELIDTAAPEGFPADVRLVTTDLGASPPLTRVLRRRARAAGNGSVDILALSGRRLGRRLRRGRAGRHDASSHAPDFEMVTGVSAGALLAPFAFLGPDWDARMQQAFTGERSARPAALAHPHASCAACCRRAGCLHHNALFKLVDHFVTPAMIAAVAREAATGREAGRGHHRPGQA